jgi:hypothetical protein
MRTEMRHAYLDVFRPSDAHRELGGRFLAIATVSLALDVVVTTVLWTMGATCDLRHAFAWTSSELITGGSGVDISGFWPHYVELALQVWAITAIAALAGSFGVFFHRLHVARSAASGSGSR